MAAGSWALSAWPLGLFLEENKELERASKPAQSTLLEMGESRLPDGGLQGGTDSPRNEQSCGRDPQPGPLWDTQEKDQKDLEIYCFMCLFSAPCLKAFLHLLPEPPEFWDPGSYFKPEPMPTFTDRLTMQQESRPPFLRLVLPEPDTGEVGDRLCFSRASWRT